MTQEEKQLLLIDLCERLPYGVKISNINAIHNGLDFPPIIIDINDYENSNPLILINSDWLPYLRPMSSMTFDECFELEHVRDKYENHYDAISAETDWLNKNMFDYRGLIPMGLALEAKEGMYEVQD